MSDDEEFDYYAELELKSTATLKEIRKAYRQLSRTCHPDRNEGPEARAKFERITKARDVLLDDIKKAKFDSGLERKAKQRQKDEALDAKTRQMKQDLVEAERRFVKRKAEQATKQRSREYHLNQLRQESLNRLEQELHAERAEEHRRAAAAAMDKGNTSICVKWKREKAGKRPGYSEHDLATVLGQLGRVVSVNIVGTKRRQAIVHFGDVHAATEAISKSGKLGHAKNKLKLSWLAALESGNGPANLVNITASTDPFMATRTKERVTFAYDSAPAPNPADTNPTGGLTSLEEDVFAMLRQAAAKQQTEAKDMDCDGPETKKARISPL